jgi:hypothetical protein
MENFMKPTNTIILETKGQNILTDTNEKCIVNWDLHHAINNTPISNFLITDMILTFNEFKKQLTNQQLASLHNHFNEIYECKQLEDREFKMAYLAYLWKNKQVVLTQDRGYEILNTESLGINVDTDYEISFEAGEDGAGGVNLGVLHDFYVFQKLEELV